MLTQPVAQAKQTIGDRLRVGRELVDKPVQHGGEMDQLTAEFGKWSAGLPAGVAHMIKPRTTGVSDVGANARARRCRVELASRRR